MKKITAPFWGGLVQRNSVLSIVPSNPRFKDKEISLNWIKYFVMKPVRGWEIKHSWTLPLALWVSF